MIFLKNFDLNFTKEKSHDFFEEFRFEFYKRKKSQMEIAISDKLPLYISRYKNNIIKK